MPITTIQEGGMTRMNMSKRKRIGQREALRLRRFKENVFSDNAGEHFKTINLINGEAYEAIRMARKLGAMVLVTSSVHGQVNIRVIKP